MKPRKILFASIAYDGHFNPLTGLAVHLKKAGHDVRWYTGSIYSEKLKKLDIPLYPFTIALDLNQYNLDEMFPERLKRKGQVSRLQYDLKTSFVQRAPEFYADIQEINRTFPFDLMIADVMFTAIPLVKEALGKPVLAIGIVPLVETSRDLAPAGLGIPPARSFWGRRKLAFLRYLTAKVLFREPYQLYRSIMKEYGIDPGKKDMVDLLVQKATLFLQSGTPGFEYQRSDLGANIRYIGALVPHSSGHRPVFSLPEKVRKFGKVILVTQGTIEKDPEKLIVPTLEAFKNSEFLVIATTGGSRTAELKKRFPQENFIIEDYIPFNDIMPFTDVYVTNGGYGGVMLSIENKVPMVVAGVHEGKNEINARVSYFQLGVNLNTERPKPPQVRAGVAQVLANGLYKTNVERLSKEFLAYDPLRLTEQYIAEIFRDTDVPHGAPEWANPSRMVL
jgi:UDP:flavonoid glycosyltransferase YjiC (YdhE family)